MKQGYHKHEGIDRAHPISVIHKNGRVRQHHMEAVGMGLKLRKPVQTRLTNVVKEQPKVTDKQIYKPVITEDDKIARFSLSELNNIISQVKSGSKIVMHRGLQLSFTLEQLDDIKGALINSKAQEIGVSLLKR